MPNFNKAIWNSIKIHIDALSQASLPIENKNTCKFSNKVITLLFDSTYTPIKPMAITPYSNRCATLVDFSLDSIGSNVNGSHIEFLQ